MFVLQDCSICFEEYDEEYIPHSIPCGHVFCRPCLISLVSSNSNCPHCRAHFGRRNIRKVIGTFQGPPALDGSALSEAEMIMWQAIASAVESVDKHEQRRSLVRDNSNTSVQEAGFSEGMLIALDVMRLLVGVEGTNRGFEESLNSRISFLEAQLNAKKASSRSSVQDLQVVLLSEMQTLMSSTRIINETAAQIADRLSSIDSPRNPVNPADSIPPGRAHLAVNPEQIQEPPQSEHAPLRNPLPAEPRDQRPSRTHATPTRSISPPTETESGTAHLTDPRLMDDSHSPSLQPAFKRAASNQVKRREETSLASSSSQTQSLSADAAASRTATVTHNYTAKGFTQISVRTGDILELIGNQNDLRYGTHLIWVRSRGKVGEVPRNHLTLSMDG